MKQRIDQLSRDIP